MKTFRFGRQTLRARLPYVVPSGRVRVAVLVGCCAAVGAAAVATCALVFGWSTIGIGRGAPGVVLLALGVGLLGAACAPLRGYGIADSTEYLPPERTERYFARQPGGVAPTIDAADRDLVIHRATATRDRLVPSVVRITLVAAGWAVGILGANLLGAPLSLLSFYWLAVLAYAVRGVVRIGYVQRANDLAELLPPVEPDAPRSSRGRTLGRGPNGSKIRLPGD